MSKKARIAAVVAAQKKRDRTKAAADNAVRELRARVQEAVADGVLLAELAEATGWSVSRVSQLKRGTNT